MIAVEIKQKWKCFEREIKKDFMSLAAETVLILKYELLGF